MPDFIIKTSEVCASEVVFLGVCCHPLNTLLFDLSLHPSGHQHVVLASLGSANDQFQEFLVIINRVVDQREIR